MKTSKVRKKGERDRVRRKEKEIESAIEHISGSGLAFAYGAVYIYFFDYVQCGVHFSTLLAVLFIIL